MVWIPRYKKIIIREVWKYEYEYWFRVWCHTMNAIFIELIHWRWITTLQFEALKLKAKGTIHLGLKLYSKHKPQNQIGGWRSEVDYKMHSHK
jgi:hypothetical protein